MDKPSEKPWEGPWAETLMPVLWSIMRGTMEGIFKLDRDSREMILSEMANKCADHAYEVYELPADGGMDIDALISEVPPRSLREQFLVRKISREGDTVNWAAETGQFGVGCMCILVLMGVIDPTCELCECGKYFCRRLIERATDSKVGTHTGSTLLRGDKEACRFIVHLKHDE